MFGDFNKIGKPKASLTIYSIEFDDFAEQQRLHRRLYLRLLGRAYKLLACEKVCGQKNFELLYSSSN